MTERSEGIGVPRSASAADRGWNAYCGRYRSFNPWARDIRVFERDGELFLVTYPAGKEDRLEETRSGGFLVGEEPAPHRVRFDAEVNGVTLRATISGAPYYRTPL
jgi:hypothetical protein